MRLGEEVIGTIGDIMNEEHPTLAILDLPDKHPGRDPNQANKYVDCRVHKRFVKNMCLKQATNFMNKEGETTSEVQINVLYRLRAYCKENSFRAANYKVVVYQYHFARLAVTEARKFEDLMGTEKWPDKLTTFKTKLLRSSDFDVELDSHEGNGRSILPSLLKEYTSTHPDDAIRNIQNYKSDEVETEEEQVGNPPLTNTTDPMTDGSPVQYSPCIEKDSVSPDQEDCRSQQGRKMPVQVPALEDGLRMGPSESRAEWPERIKTLLKTVNVEVYHGEWDMYLKIIWNEDDDDFDIVLCYPPFRSPKNPSKAGDTYDDHLRDRDFTLYSSKCFAALRRGGSVFIMSSADYAPKWKNALQQADFDVWKGLFVMIRSMKGRQMRRKGMFSQVFNEFGVIARKPGNRSDKFTLNLQDVVRTNHVQIPPSPRRH